MPRDRHRAAGRAIAATLALHVATLSAADNVGHRHHEVRHGTPHRVVQDPERFTTSRTGRDLHLPVERDCFTFAVFGDRTGGPVEGVSVLAEAVHDVNLLVPDLVMTVGDLVEGYNQTPKWMEEMTEFRGIMDHLLMPWFPVAGNHDVYVAEGLPHDTHEANYERHFGPLWYAFEHERCWFVVLHSDEGDPATGVKAFNKPVAQRMSDAQFSWLRATLERTRGARHVFLFLHHPRWTGGSYGDDWERVHALLAEAGNVSVVFAGHIHRMRYDGPRDGIEYVTLATTGGGQEGTVPEAGWLHHFHLVTVDGDDVSIAAIPVGEVLDPREISGPMTDEVAALAGSAAEPRARLAVGRDGSVEGSVTTSVSNPTSRPVEVTVLPDSRDSRWTYAPDHRHALVQPGAREDFEFTIARPSGLDDALRPLEMIVRRDYLAPGRRYPVPESRLPVSVELPRPKQRAGRWALRLGGDDALRVPSDRVRLTDGPFTVECRFEAADPSQVSGLVAKTEISEWGLFVMQRKPVFYVWAGDAFVIVVPPEPVVEAGRWHHAAGVFDGREARVYLDGRMLASLPVKGALEGNELPLHVGAEVNARAEPVRFFEGRIDDVRLSSFARYEGESFQPPREVEADARTALLLDMEHVLGTLVFDSSAARADALMIGSPRMERLDIPGAPRERLAR